jgi:threonine aldolase
LYEEIGRYAIDMAERLKKIFADKGYRFFLESPTNQQFVILDNSKLKELEKQVSFGFWEKYSDTETVVRFATSWSTTEEDLKFLESVL